MNCSIQTKLLIGVIISTFLSVGWGMFYHYSSVIDNINKNSLVIEELTSKERARQVQQAFSFTVVDFIRQGKMGLFSQLIDRANEIDHLLNFALINAEGRIVHQLKKKEGINTQSVLPVINKIIKAQKVYLETSPNNRTINIYDPLVVKSFCKNCHINWKEGDIAGFLYYSFDRNGINSFAKHNQKQVKEIKSDIKKTSLIAMIIILIITGVFSLILSYLFVKKPISDIDRMLNNDKFNLLRKVNTNSGKEIQNLALNFNNFLALVANSVNKAKLASSDIKTTVQESLKNTISIKSNTELVKFSSHKNISISEKLQIEADKLIELVKENHNYMNKLIEKNKDLVNYNKEILGINNAIKEVALQTNILSLNAAVEAAQAGEAGEGFNIVAKEVRMLSRRVTSLVQDTEDFIQKCSTLAQGNLDETIRVRDKSETSLNKANETFSLILDISESNKEQLNKFELLLQDVFNITQGINYVDKSCENLIEEINHFKT